MNTYTIRALTGNDAVTVAHITGNHRAYRNLVKQGQAGGEPVEWSSWCGIFEVNVSELLEIIERLTRPDAEHSSDGGFRYPVNHQPARSRVERVTGNGWPA